MEAEAGPLHNLVTADVSVPPSLVAPLSPSVPSELPPPLVAPPGADATIKAEAGAPVRAGLPIGDATMSEPPPLVDGRPPERSWLPRPGSGAGRVDLYRVKKMAL